MPIEIQAGGPGQRANWLAAMSAPTDPTELLTDYLPDILGIPDDQSFAIVKEYLYNENDLVRWYAMNGLTYWPARQANDSVWQLMQKRGPSDVIVTFLTRSADFLRVRADSMVDVSIPYVTSPSKVHLRGAVTVIRQVAELAPFHASAGVRARAEDAFIGAADHILDTADPQTVREYAATLGLFQDSRASEVLWTLVDRGVEQARIALTWRKQSSDLPRLVELALAPANGRDLDDGLASLPYSLRNAYGDAALPYLETLLSQSEFTWVRLNSAKELMIAGRASGFRFAAEAIENSTRPYRREMIDFVRSQFPTEKAADDAAILHFVKEQALK
jgi:hypothetical protein